MVYVYFFADVSTRLEQVIDLRQICCIINRSVINKRHLAVWPVLNIVKLEESTMRSLVILACTIAAATAQCSPSVTTAFGTKAPATICSGDLIFNDDFNTFDLWTWNHEKTAAGGGVSDMTCISPQFKVLGLWGCDAMFFSYCFSVFRRPLSLKRPLLKLFILIEWTSTSSHEKLEIAFMKAITLCH
jgi:hypothetical protein